MEVKSIPKTDLQKIRGGFLFEFGGEKNYMTDDLGSPIAEEFTQSIIDKLNTGFPVKWLPENIYLAPYRLRNWTESYGWSQDDHDGETYNDKYIVVGAQKNNLEAGHTIVHEIGHLIFHHLVSPEVWEEWLKIRGLQDGTDFIWHNRPTEIFAEDFYYLFWPGAEKESYSAYDGTPDPPGSEIRRWFLGLVGDKQYDLKNNRDASRKVIELWIDKDIAVVNGKAEKIDQAPQLKLFTGRTMVPLRFISEKLGCQVDWSKTERKITITQA